MEKCFFENEDQPCWGKIKFTIVCPDLVVYYCEGHSDFSDSDTCRYRMQDVSVEKAHQAQSGAE